MVTTVKIFFTGLPIARQVPAKTRCVVTDRQRTHDMSETNADLQMHVQGFSGVYDVFVWRAISKEAGQGRRHDHDGLSSRLQSRSSVSAAIRSKLSLLLCTSVNIVDSYAYIEYASHRFIRW
jgi:hypothetical protein